MPLEFFLPARLGLSESRTHQVRRRRMALVLGVIAAASFLGGLVDGASGPTSTAKKPAARTLTSEPKRRTAPNTGTISPPDGSRAIDRVRSYTPLVAQGGRRKREIALTFDDGPAPLTPQFVRLLRHERVPATFFVVGQQLNDFATGTREAIRAGFGIGGHTENHPLLASLPGAEQRKQISDADLRLRSLGAPPVRLFRPPGRSFNPTTLRVLRRMRLLMILWSVDTKDYTRPGTAAIVKNVLSAAKPGAIVLMHDGGGDRSQTLAALPAVIRGLRKRGYRLVSIPQLLAGDPPPRNQRVPRSSAG